VCDQEKVHCPLANISVADKLIPCDLQNTDFLDGEHQPQQLTGKNLN
jgi:hypothetical protein